MGTKGFEFVQLRWDLMKFGDDNIKFHVFDTDLKQFKEFTGNLGRISEKMSSSGSSPGIIEGFWGN